MNWLLSKTFLFTTDSFQICRLVLSKKSYKLSSWYNFPYMAIYIVFVILYDLNHICVHYLTWMLI